MQHTAQTVKTALAPFGLMQAADRLELAIAAGVEYREACLQLQQKKQVIQGLGSGFPEPRTAGSRMAIQLSGAPAVPGVSQHVEACLNLHLTGGNTKGVSTAQQSVCPQRTSNQTSEQPRATGDSAPDGTLPSSTQRLGFADIVTRLRAVLTRAGEELLLMQSVLPAGNVMPCENVERHSSCTDRKGVNAGIY